VQAEPAPPGLSLVEELVNTRSIEDDDDALAGPAELRAWLLDRGLVGPEDAVTGSDLARALDLREAVRALLVANNGGGPPSPPALEVLNRAGVRARFLVVFEGRSAHLVPEARGVDGALGRILAVVRDAMEAGVWGRLKACRNEGCRWAFVDRSKNRGRTWCAMASCGGRSKARAYRARRRGAGA
jgi:predicted RNA-binding Zn ribbon-like protein